MNDGRWCFDNCNHNWLPFSNPAKGGRVKSMPADWLPSSKIASLKEFPSARNLSTASMAIWLKRYMLSSQSEGIERVLRVRWQCMASALRKSVGRLWHVNV